MKLILGSGSPRRKEILAKLGYSFQSITADVTESEDATLGLKGLSIYNAKLKAQAVYNYLGTSDNLVIGSDTVVWLDGEAYGKPSSPEEAHEFLSELSGKTHQVGTAVALTSEKKTEVFCEIAHVTFKTLTKAEIKSYVNDIPVMDKAGAYAIQNGGDRIIAHYEGEFETIMGLPSNRLARALEPYSL